MTKKTRSELEKEHHQKLEKIWNKHHVQPSITLEYIYMKQENEKEALEMLTLEVQRSLLYSNPLAYNDYSGKVDYIMQSIIKELSK